MDGAPSVQVRLCSSAAKVPLSPEEGIGALKSRVAGAFGLTAPFDILGPEGRLTTDEDAAQALKGEGSELSISHLAEKLDGFGGNLRADVPGLHGKNEDIMRLFFKGRVSFHILSSPVVIYFSRFVIQKPFEI